MNWKNYFSTSIGKKLQMSFTGIFLILFLVVHCYVNAQIFWNDGGVKFNEAAHFMGTNFVIRTIEIGLFAFLIIHIVQGLLLWKRNTARRSTGYAVKPKGKNKTSPWYRRSMGILGSLVLLFLIVHLSKFWGPNRYAQTFGSGELDLYARMKDEFSVLWIVIFYVLGCFALAWHLVHGFYSSFQTLGLTTHRYKKIINYIGVAFSIIVPLIFALMPVSFYFGWLS
ncbi:MAG TPA: succinate dehydrogenase cytochrome b subunit [Flavipsychrobacter sp.]|nr:succinate dehydrogenase cytochrome b subunit [Flavipsychrobacter sp.]